MKIFLLPRQRFIFVCSVYPANMAWIQLCCRKLVVSNTSRFFIHNAIFLQPSRKRHHLLQVLKTQNKITIQKSKLVFHSGRMLTYRWASTNAPEFDQVVSSDSKIPDAENELAQANDAPNIVESSSTNVVIDENMLPPLPITEPVEPPVLEFISMGLKEPSFQSLGLGSWWPSGLIQQLMEFIHIDLGLAWWQAITLVSIVSRILLFPINLSNRRDSINMANNFPELQKIQLRINDARQRGDYYAAASESMELENFIKKNNLNMMGFLKNALIQGPVFLSIFYALRGMANVPVESLKTEGLFWFKDLTTTDPYYLLPLILSTTLFAVIEVGAEGNPAKANSHAIKWILRGIPAVVFVVALNFPTCIAWYWTVSNFIVLSQVALFKIPVVKKVFKIPESRRFDPQSLPKPKGFFEGFKEGYAQAKMRKQIEDRERMNLNAFKQAGNAPVPRTFKNNPLWQEEKKTS